MKRWRVGMVGYGWAAGAHIGALNLVENLEVVADLHVPGRVDAAELERCHGHPIEIVRDLDELLARPDIDVIDLCSRSGLHAAQAIAAARAGKHLIIEKPIALEPRGHARRRGCRHGRRRPHVRLPAGALLAAVHDDEEPGRAAGWSARCTTPRSTTSTTSGRRSASTSGT